jgi:hypothetical protein
MRQIIRLVVIRLEATYVRQFFIKLVSDRLVVNKC